MTLFHYKAIDRAGAAINGEMEADDRAVVLDQLSQNGAFAVEVAAVTSRSGSSRRSSFSFGNKVSKDEITILTRELAMLLQAGITLDQALGLLEEDQSKRRLKELIGRIRFSLKEGKSFARALEAQGAVFPPVYTNMVRVAEATGTLQNILEQIAESREREQKLRAKVLSAALYPGFLVISAIAMIVLLLTFVVPRFKTMIESAGAAVPDSAKLVIAASDWLNTNWQLLIVAILATVLCILFLSSRAWFRRQVDRAVLALPVIGAFARLNLSIRLCRTLSTLLKSGIDLPEALSLSRRVVTAPSANDALGKAYESLRKGQSFIAPLAASSLFPSVMINMLKVGEETGNLAPSTHYLAQMFEDKLDLRMQRTMTILEPAIILLVAGLVAGIIIAILGAVISVNDLAL